MEKTILVDTLPKTCNECDQKYFHQNGWEGYVACFHTKEKIKEIERLQCCPLKLMPERKEYDGLMEFDDIFADGYNACIDAIVNS